MKSDPKERLLLGAIAISFLAIIAIIGDVYGCGEWGDPDAVRGCS